MATDRGGRGSCGRYLLLHHPRHRSLRWLTGPWGIRKKRDQKMLLFLNSSIFCCDFVFSPASPPWLPLGPLRPYPLWRHREAERACGRSAPRVHHRLGRGKAASSSTSRCGRVQERRLGAVGASPRKVNGGGRGIVSA